MKYIATISTVVSAAGALFCATARAIPAPTAYYSLDGNTNDSSTPAYNGTVNGTTQYGPGQGQTDAFLFDGGTDIATTTTDNLGLVGASFTVDAVVNFANTNDQSIFGTNGGSADMALHLGMRGDQAYFGFWGDDTAGNQKINANQWYNIAFVYDSVAKTQTIYIDGAVDNSTGGHSNFAGTGETAYIGNSCCLNLAGNGTKIEALGVWDSALSQSDIQTLLPEPSIATLCSLIGMFAVGRRRRRV